MKPIILTVIILFSSAFRVFAQSNWDGVLDRYEEICNTCIEMREMMEQGRTVPYGKISSVLEEMNSLREKINSTSSSMTPRQRQRFIEIRNKYSIRFGGAVDVTLSGDNLVPMIDSIVKDSAHYFADEVIMPVSSSATTVPRGRIHVGLKAVAEISKDVQYGLSVSGRYGKWGGYVSAVSNFKFTSAAYSCTSDGRITGGGVFWGDGTVSHFALAITAGPSFLVWKYVDLFAGCGYWSRKTFWRDVSGKWADVTDLRIKSFCAEGGAGFHLKSFTVSAGVRYSPAVNSFSAIAGLGVEF